MWFSSPHSIFIYPARYCKVFVFKTNKKRAVSNRVYQKCNARRSIYLLYDPEVLL